MLKRNSIILANVNHSSNFLKQCKNIQIVIPIQYQFAKFAKIQNLNSFQYTIQSIFWGRKGTQEEFWFVSIFHNNQSHQFKLCNIAAINFK